MKTEPPVFEQEPTTVPVVLAVTYSNRINTTEVHGPRFIIVARVMKRNKQRPKRILTQHITSHHVKYDPDS